MSITCFLWKCNDIDSGDDVDDIAIIHLSSQVSDSARDPSLWFRQPITSSHYDDDDDGDDDNDNDGDIDKVVLINFVIPGLRFRTQELYPIWWTEQRDEHQSLW